MIDRRTLERCRALRKEVDRIRERIREISPKTTVRLDYVSRGTTRGQPTEEAAIARIDLDTLLTDTLRSYTSIVDDIATACVNLEPSLREVVLMRYVDGNDWDEVADRLRYSEAHVYELHRIALRELSKQ